MQLSSAMAVCADAKAFRAGSQSCMATADDDLRAQTFELSESLRVARASLEASQAREAELSESLRAASAALTEADHLSVRHGACVAKLREQSRQVAEHRVQDPLSRWQELLPRRRLLLQGRLPPWLGGPGAHALQ